MNICDNLMKCILARSIVNTLIDRKKYDFNVVNKTLLEEIHKISLENQLMLLNFLANVERYVCKYVNYSVVHSDVFGQFTEVTNVMVTNINDKELYEIVVTTFINTVFETEPESKQTELINLCLNSMSIFNEVVNKCNDLNFIDKTEEVDNNIFIDDCDFYSEYDDCNYDEGYDSVS